MEIRELPELLRRQLGSAPSGRAIRGWVVYRITFCCGRKTITCEVKLEGIDGKGRFVFQPDCDATYHVAVKDIVSIKRVQSPLQILRRKK